MRNWIAAILAVAALAAGGTAGYKYMQERNAGSEYESVKEAVFREVTPPPAGELTSAQAPDQEDETPIVTATPAAQEPLPEEVLSIDWDKLKETCPDAYAWIRIDGTEIDYPIVQHPTDDTYYLDHSAEGEEAIAGAIFTEKANAKDFTDPNTVIYGHNMRNGSMFKGLHQYKDPVFFAEHQTIKIILPDKMLDVRVFAAYTTDNRHQLNSYDYSDPEVFRAYLRDIQSLKEMGAVTDPSVSVTEDDRIVTLSTCNGNAAQRYIVQGVIVTR